MKAKGEEGKGVREKTNGEVKAQKRRKHLEGKKRMESKRRGRQIIKSMEKRRWKIQKKGQEQI